TAPLEMLRQAATYVRVNLPERGTRVPKTKVIRPATQMSIQILNQHRDGIATVPTTDQLPQLGPLPCEGLRGGKHVQVAMAAPLAVTVLAEGESQKVQGHPFLLQVNHSGLAPVDLQPHPGFQLRLDEPPELPTLIARQHDKVISIAHQLGLGPVGRTAGSMKHRIEPVPVQISQQGRDHSP